MAFWKLSKQLSPLRLNRFIYRLSDNSACKVSKLFDLLLTPVTGKSRHTFKNFRELVANVWGYMSREDDTFGFGWCRCFVYQSANSFFYQSWNFQGWHDGRMLSRTILSVNDNKRLLHFCHNQSNISSSDQLYQQIEGCAMWVQPLYLPPTLWWSMWRWSPGILYKSLIQIYNRFVDGTFVFLGTECRTISYGFETTHPASKFIK